MKAHTSDAELSRIMINIHQPSRQGYKTYLTAGAIIHRVILDKTITVQFGTKQTRNNKCSDKIREIISKIPYIRTTRIRANVYKFELI